MGGQAQNEHTDRSNGEQKKWGKCAHKHTSKRDGEREKNTVDER